MLKWLEWCIYNCEWNYITFAALAAAGGTGNKKIEFKNCSPFTDCFRKINNTQEDNDKDINIVIPTYNLIEYSNNYLETSGSSCQYYRDEASLNNHDAVFGFTVVNNNTKSFIYNQKQL